MIFLPLIAALAAASPAPKVGEVAPDFTAQDSEGNRHTLSELVKTRTVVVAFFPRAFTPG